MAISNYIDKPILTADLKTQNTNLEEFINVAQAYGVSALDGIEASSGPITLDVKLNGPFANLDYQGAGSLENATLTLPTLAKPLQVKTARLSFDDGRAVLDNLQATLAGSNLRGSMKLKNFAAPQIEFNADIDQLNVAELQQLTKAAPAAKAPVKAAGKSSAPASSPLLKTLARGTLNIGKIQYTNLTLTKLRSESSLEKGILKLDPLTADLFGGQQKGAITIDLRPENPTYHYPNQARQSERE